MRSKLPPHIGRLFPTTRPFSSTSHVTRHAATLPTIAFDMDGVLIRGGKAISSARRALEKLRGDNAKNVQVPFVVLTNSGGQTEGSKARLLSKKLDFEIHPHQMILSHSPMRHLAQKYGNVLVHVVGNETCKEVAKAYGFKHVVTSREIRNWDRTLWPYEVVGDEEDVECPYDLSQTPIAATLIFHDPPDWGRDIQLITDILSTPPSAKGLITQRQSTYPFTQSTPLYSSNADFLWANEWAHPRYGQGGFVTALRAVWERVSGGTHLHIHGQFGKPHRETYIYAEKVLRANADRLAAETSGSRRVAAPDQLNAYMVGDNPDSDIAGAVAYGWNSVLLRTGVYRDGFILEPRNTPTVVVHDVGEAVDWILRREGIEG
ncbi:HAD hydrolase [Phlyctochytrium arcticum]|nr:HAD hydrolase [Phlyctochytrium arcticum]